MLDFDVENRLSRAYLGSQQLVATYRADGLRARKQVVVSGTGPSTYYLYDGTHLLCELNSSGQVTACYGWGATGVTQRYVPSVGYTAYTFDPQGNVVSRLTSDTKLAQPADLSGYDAFGKRFLYTALGQTVANTTVPPDALGYGGQWGNYTDGETGLVLMTFRYYSPLYCRFVTRDPVGYEGGVNLYAYCRNNPVNRADPSGLAGNEVTNAATALTEQQAAAAAVAAARAAAAAAAVAAARAAAAANAARIAALNVAAEGTLSVEGGLGAGSSLGSLGPYGFAAAGIVAAATLTYHYSGVPVALHLYGPQTLDTSGVDPAYASLFNRLRNCFVAGTLISMSDGTFKPIEQVQQGDWVLSRDEQTGQTQARQVVQTFVNTAENTLVLHFANGEQVETTPGHPFYVEGQGWTLAGQLALGNAIVTRAGPAAILTHIENKNASVRVYNFEVEGTHTYFVGNHDGGLWVHNICRPFAQNADLNNKLIEQMYRGHWNNGSWSSTDKYPGGLAGAIRRQLNTGELVGGRDHLPKGEERINQIKTSFGQDQSVVSH